MNSAIVIVDYTDFVRTYLWLIGPSRASAVPVNLTGYGALFEVRAQPTDTAALISITTTANAQGQITLGGAAGTISVWIYKAAVVSLVDAAWPQMGYGLNLITPGGVTQPILQGSLSVVPGYAHG